MHEEEITEKLKRDLQEAHPGKDANTWKMGSRSQVWYSGADSKTFTVPLRFVYSDPPYALNDDLTEAEKEAHMARARRAADEDYELRDEEKLHILQKKLGALLKEAGWSQQEVAEKTGFQQSQISRWLGRSSKGVPVYALLRIAEHIDFDWQKFFNLQRFPISLPRGIERPLVDLIQVGETDGGGTAVHKEDLRGRTYFLGKSDAGLSDDVLLATALALAEQCEPMMIVSCNRGETKNFTARFLQELEERSPLLLGHVAEVDLTVAPINPFHIKSIEEVPFALRTLEEMLRGAEYSFSYEERQIVLAAAQSLLETALQSKHSVTLFDLEDFFLDLEYRQLVMHFTSNEEGRILFKDGYLEHMEEEARELLREKLSRFLNSLKAAPGFSASDNVLPALLGANIVCAHLPAEEAAGRAVFAVLQSYLGACNNHRTAALHDFQKYSSVDALLERPGFSYLLQTDEMYIHNPTSRDLAFYFDAEHPLLWPDYDLPPGGQFWVQSTGAAPRALKKSPIYSVADASPLYRKQIENFFQNWMSGAEQKTPLRSSLLEASAEWKEIVQAAADESTREARQNWMRSSLAMLLAQSYQSPAQRTFIREPWDKDEITDQEIIENYLRGGEEESSASDEFEWGPVEIIGDDASSDDASSDDASSDDASSDDASSDDANDEFDWL